VYYAKTNDVFIVSRVARWKTASDALCFNVVVDVDGRRLTVADITVKCWRTQK